MKDDLGNRMKQFYEDRTRFLLPRRTYTIIRIDGKAFHTYTRGLKQPFDQGLIDDMDATACYLCKNIQGSKFGYVQSDEISILMTDFDAIGTDAWFDGNIQKIVSVAAGLATAEFNRLRMTRILSAAESLSDLATDLSKMRLATFDARVFTIPADYEVENYFIWRQKDATKNSISSVARTLYSQKEVDGKNSDQKQEMIFQKGINWNDYNPKLKRGRFITKEIRILTNDAFKSYNINNTYERSVWVSVDCPIFTQDREFLQNKIPKMI
ncbi:MAG: tRNA(His) guanylyltransferase Thg1 family protein [Candidatus Paceibacterota bacterium]